MLTSTNFSSVKSLPAKRLNKKTLPNNVLTTSDIIEMLVDADNTIADLFDNNNNGCENAFNPTKIAKYILSSKANNLVIMPVNVSGSEQEESKFVKISHKTAMFGLMGGKNTLLLSNKLSVQLKLYPELNGYSQIEEESLPDELKDLNLEETKYDANTIKTLEARYSDASPNSVPQLNRWSKLLLETKIQQTDLDLELKVLFVLCSLVELEVCDGGKSKTNFDSISGLGTIKLDAKIFSTNKKDHVTIVEGIHNMSVCSLQHHASFVDNLEIEFGTFFPIFNNVVYISLIAKCMKVHCKEYNLTEL